MVLQVAFGLILAPFGMPLGTLFAKSGASDESREVGQIWRWIQRPSGHPDGRDFSGGTAASALNFGV